MVWPEVEQALKNRRYELVLSGEKLSSLFAEKNQFDSNIWKLHQLNFLEISNCSLIEALPSDLGELIHLITLTLTNNRLRSLPQQMSSLNQLRHLNVSFNQLEQLDEQIFKDLSQLETLNLSNNRFKHLPKFFGETNKRLAIVNVSHNLLTSLEHFSEELENLSQLDFSSNRFEQFPETIVNLPSLKILNFEDNLLTEIPTELTEMNKLKDLRLKSNPIKDNRLKKLIEQDKGKAVLEYLAKLNQQQQKKDKQKTNAVVSPKTQNNASSSPQHKIQILHFDQPDPNLQGKESLSLSLPPLSDRLV